MILTIITFVVILAVLVIVHELGHFSVARLFKMFVAEFGFGFPPRIFSKKIGETTWSFNAVPLGGFVRIPGEDGISKDGDAPTTLDPDEEDLSTIPSQRLFASHPAWQRILVLCAGVFMNFLVGWILLAIVFSVGVKSSVVITDVSKDSPAYTAGLAIGDRIDGYASVDEFINAVNLQKGKEFSFSYSRAGQDELKTVTIIPRSNPPEGQGALGVGLGQEGVESQSFWASLWSSLQTSIGFFGMIFVLLFKLILSPFTGENIVQNLSGPVGVFQATAQASHMGFLYIANLAAIISLNLAALNIFPFPALDGGRVLFVLLEKIKGKPLSFKAQTIANSIGFGLVILLLIYVTVQDVIRIL